jgi:hypothetical protein
MILTKLRAPLILDLQILCLSYLDILQYKKNDMITIYNKKVYDIWYKNSKHEIKINLYKKEWYVNNKLHRNNDKPAIEYSDGDKKWYQNGKLHRNNDKPAIINKNGNKYWYKNGRWYRDNEAEKYLQPAIKWYKNDKLNRDRHIDHL